MKHPPRKADRRRRRRPSAAVRALKWVAIIAVVGLLGFGVMHLSSGVPYDETSIRVVDFSALTGAQKLGALQAANRARCPCGCGMNVAQCLATDSTCPLREENIQKVRTMVRDARVGTQGSGASAAAGRVARR
jgi:hypothetical protein